MNRLHKCPCVQVCVRVWWCSNSTERSCLWPWWYITLNNRGGNAMEKDESWDCEHTLTALGFRSAALSEQRQHTLLAYATCRDKHRHAALIQVLKIWSAPFFVMEFFFPQFMIAVKPFPPKTGHEDRLWPPFQLRGSLGSPRLLKKRKALATALGFSPACHKMSPDTKPSHSYQRTPTALPTNVTSFIFLPLPARKKGKT